MGESVGENGENMRLTDKFVKNTTKIGRHTDEGFFVYPFLFSSFIPSKNGSRS